jgi:hypothetical protein
LQNFRWTFVHGHINRFFRLLEAAFQKLHARGGLSRAGVATHEIGAARQKPSL